MPQFSSVIVDHFQNPRNLGELEDANVSVRVGDPMCGDKINLTLECADGRIQQAAFKAYGCAPTLALGSLLTELVTERSVAELTKIDTVEFNTLLGGLKPSQKHVASLGCRLLAELVSRQEIQES